MTGAHYFIIIAFLVPLAGWLYRFRSDAMLSGFTGARVLHFLAGSMLVASPIVLLGDAWWRCLLVWLGTAAIDSLPHSEFQRGQGPEQNNGMLVVGITQSLAASLVSPLSAASSFFLSISWGVVSMMSYIVGNDRKIMPSRIAGLSTQLGPEQSEFLYGMFRLAVFALFMSYQGVSAMTLTQNHDPGGNSTYEFVLNKFVPIAYYDKHMNFIRVVTQDRSVTEHQINEFYTIHECNNKGKFDPDYVGFTIKNVTHLFADLGLALPGVYKLADLIQRIIEHQPASSMAHVLRIIYKELGSPSDLEIDIN